MQFAVRAQEAVARGQGRSARVVEGVVAGCGSLDRDVPQCQVAGAGAVPEEERLFQMPLADRRAGLVEYLQGQCPEGRRSFGTRARVRASLNCPSGAQPGRP
jgi:hypothetical protein